MHESPLPTSTVVPLTLTLFLTLTLIPNGARGQTGEGDDEDESGSCLPDYPCTPGFKVWFDGAKLKCGQKAEQDIASKKPDLQFEAVADKSDGNGVKFDIREEEKMLVMMVDPDAPSAAQCPQRYWLHWMAFAHMKKKAVIPTDGIVDYKGPSPPPDSGPHRYQLLLFYVDNTKEVDSKTVVAPQRSNFNLKPFLSSLGVENPVASFQFLAEN